MPYNGSGVFAAVYNWTNEANAGINIRSDHMDTQDGDIATGLTTAICKDGQTTPTANLPMGGFKHTNVANGSARTDYASIAQIQDGGIIYGGTAGGTASDITITLSPAITAYAPGMLVAFIAAADSTGATTLNINSVGAIAIKKNTSDALEAGDIKNGHLIFVGYDGTNFQLLYDLQGKNINMAAKVLLQSEIRNYSETVTTANTGTAYTIDLTNGNVFDLTLTGNCTFTFSNPPAAGKNGSFTLYLKQDGTGGRSTTWPASVKWSNGGSVPNLTTAAGAQDILAFSTKDGGTTWFGFLGGINFG